MDSNGAKLGWRERKQTQANPSERQPVGPCACRPSGGGWGHAIAIKIVQFSFRIRCWLVIFEIILGGIFGVIAGSFWVSFFRCHFSGSFRCHFWCYFESFSVSFWGGFWGSCRGHFWDHFGESFLGSLGGHLQGHFLGSLCRALLHFVKLRWATPLSIDCDKSQIPCFIQSDATGSTKF